MRQWLLAVLVCGSFAAQGAKAPWFNKKRVEISASRLSSSIEDFRYALRGIPGTKGLKTATRRYQDAAEFFETSIGAKTPNLLLQSFKTLAQETNRFRRRVKGFHVREGSNFFVRDYFAVAEAFTRLEYAMTAASGSGGPGGPGGKPTLKPVELKQTFVTSTGLYSPSPSNFTTAERTSRVKCEAWRNQVSKSTVGTTVLAQCSGGQQFKGPDGKVWVKVNGEVSLNFDRLGAMAQPFTTAFDVFVSTGLYGPSNSNMAAAANAARSQCETWAKTLVSNSEGSVLYTSCGGTTMVKGFDGKMGMQLKASASVSWKQTKSSPRAVKNTFQVSTGLFGPSTSNLEQARQQAWAQCQRWIQDTKSNSSASMVLASCEGPSIVKPSKVAVQYKGQILLLVP